MTESSSSYYRSSFPPELLHEWEKKLNSSSPQDQWKVFEQMQGLTDFQILKLIADFLLSEHGEPFIKTRFLQQLKRTCPWSIPLDVHKENQRATVDTREVPLAWEEWPEEARAPLLKLEEKAFDDPVLIEMGKELWLYVLERHYPFFIPSSVETCLWTAGLHYYTLKLVYEQEPSSFFKEKMDHLYSLSIEQIEQQSKHLLAKLQ